MLLHSEESDTQREKTNFNALATDYIQRAIDAYKNKDKNMAVEIEKTFNDDVGEVLITPQVVGRVISYIIDNALYSVCQKKVNQPDFTPQVKISTKKENEYVVLTIWDNGEGIPTSCYRKIFEPFYTTKPTGTGTGLGLSICYDTIVKQHDGEIDVISEEGKYSQFTIKLPISRKSNAT